MDIKTFVLEVLRLIKREKLTIILTALAVTVLAVAVQLLSIFDFSSNQETPIEETSIPVEIDLYIEQELMGAFSNSYLVEILMTDPEVIDTISNETQVDFQPVLEAFAEETEPIYSTEDPINVERNTSSNVMTATFDVGTDEDNMAVAEAYYNWFENTDAPFFEDKEIFMIREPEFIEVLEVRQTASGIPLTSIAKRTILGAAAGILLGLVLAVLKVLINDKINYSFTYGWNTNDIYIKETDSTMPSKIAHDILNSGSRNLSIISESDLPVDISDQLSQYNTEKYKLYRNVSEVPVDETIDEFVFIIKREETSKDWYNSQRRDLKLYPDSRVKIVEI